MKSEPGRSAVSTSTVVGGSVSVASRGARPLRGAGAGCCAWLGPGLAARAALPATAVLRKLRRLDAITPPGASEGIISTGERLSAFRGDAAGAARPWNQ